MNPLLLPYIFNILVLVPIGPLTPEMKRMIVNWMRVSRDVLSIIQITTTMHCCNMRPQHCVLFSNA